MFDHDAENARAARRAHETMMRTQCAERLYVFYREGQIEAFPESIDPRQTGPGWSLAWPEALPMDRTVDGLIAYFAARTRSLPYLPPELPQCACPTCHARYATTDLAARCQRAHGATARGRR